MANKKKKKKKKNLTKAELLFKLRCNEVASKNISKFMSGELSLEDLMEKVYGVKKVEKTGGDLSGNDAK